MGCFQSADAVLIEKLTKSPFFSLDVTNTSYLASLAKCFTKITYSAEDVLWTKGALITSFNIIIEGDVILKFKEEDEPLIIVKKGEGQCFGFHALRDMTSFQSTEDDAIGVSYDCVAVTDLTVYQITADRLLRFCP